MLEISEAGSEEIVTLVAGLHSCNLIEVDRLLETFAEALKRLYRWKLIRVARCQLIDGRCVWPSLPDTDREEIVAYLTNCP